MPRRTILRLKEKRKLFFQRKATQEKKTRLMKKCDRFCFYFVIHGFYYVLAFTGFLSFFEFFL